MVAVVQAAEAAAKVEDCLLQHACDLARGLGLHLHVSSKTLTALPLVLPGYIPDQRGLPEFGTTLADIFGQPSGSSTFSIRAKVLNRAITHLGTRGFAAMLTIVHALQALAHFYAFTDCGNRAEIGWQVVLV